MAKRKSKSVYRRRQVVALLIVLLPVLIVARACTSHGDTPTPSTTPTASETVTVTKSAAKASATPTASETSATPTPVITDCSNADIAVSVTADAEQYAIGAPVTIAMRISNIGKVECTRDIGALANEVYVTDIDGIVMWSSDACQKDAKPQVVTLKPGRVFGNSQTWAGLNSGRDCTAAAPEVAPGDYFAHARNDTVQSKAFAFKVG